MNTNLNQLLKDLEIGPAYVKILICLLGCTFMLYPTFFHFTCFFRELPVYEQVLFTSGSSALYTGVGILLSAISPVRYPRILSNSFCEEGDELEAFGEASVMISIFICLFFLNEECNRFKLFSTVLSVMYLLQFIAGGISILKEKKGEKDNAHY